MAGTTTFLMDALFFFDESDRFDREIDKNVKTTAKGLGTTR